ncbi:MAG TPA: ATP synthase F1 subunit delta [Phycisphaerales bacterium]|nr:ATP synthase F1 subunit delta [Phycisphaerales bacterium]HCD31529.1 ATP synthase F1 subunit delta [Phycisphaerales bacterium]|tara:strand:- start:346 stop:948 length:603 start_codon:yes stop_codon:yes gene_type:complete
MPQHIEKVARTVEDIYGLALVEMAQKAGALDATAAEVDELAQLLGSEPQLAKLFASRVLGTSERASSLERLFKGQLSDLVYNFVQTVNRKGRMDKLQGIFKSFGRIVDERNGIVEVDLYVAAALEPEALDALGQKIGVAISRNVILNQKVDENLIGGLKLRVGDRLIDGSIATQLKILERKIVAEGREKAKNQLEALISE